MFKGQKGITLVALVITIIVLLILAGVSISLVVGENGVLNRAQDAVKEQKVAEVKEAIALSINSADAYWGSVWANNTSYTRADAYKDDDNGIIAEMAKQGYEMTGIVTPDGSTNTWTVKNGNTTFNITCTLSKEGKVDFTSVTFTDA